MPAIPKQPRIKNPELIKRIRSRGGCQILGCNKPAAVHHIKSKGSGGHDISPNLVRLCPDEHHPAAHWGRISKVTLIQLAEQRIAREGE